MAGLNNEKMLMLYVKLIVNGKAQTVKYYSIDSRRFSGTKTAGCGFGFIVSGSTQIGSQSTLGKGMGLCIVIAVVM